MRLSVITTITNPQERQDKWLEALDCYSEVADQVIVVDGHDWYDDATGKEVGIDHHALFTARFPDKHHKVRWIYLDWPYEWNWIELPKHLNAGLEACSGGWVIKMDIDQFFHEKDKDAVRERLGEAERKHYPVVTFSKFTVVSPQKAYQKGQMPIAINRRFKDICFGQALDEETDLCYPILKTGTRLVDGYDLPVGKLVRMRFNTGVRYYNYDYFFKEVGFARGEFERFRRAYRRFWGREYYKFDDFLSRIKRYKKDGPYDLKLAGHPTYIRGEVERVMKGELEVIGSP